jgi:CheY-like chemotaxis protein
MMPDMSGLEVLRRIRSRYSPEALPVIMVTANNQSADVVEALELGANDYVCGRARAGQSAGGAQAPPAKRSWRRMRR